MKRITYQIEVNEEKLDKALKAGNKALKESKVKGEINIHSDNGKQVVIEALFQDNGKFDSIKKKLDKVFKKKSLADKED